MDQWYTKQLGKGAAVFQNLRELRDVRFQYDPGVSAEQVYIVAVDTLTSEMKAYFPPGNQTMAVRCRAVPCLRPDFDGHNLRKVGQEEFPIVPAFAADHWLYSTDQ